MRKTVRVVFICRSCTKHNIQEKEINPDDDLRNLNMKTSRTVEVACDNCKMVNAVKVDG